MNATRMIIEALKQDGLALECASAELQGDRGVEFIILLRSTPQSLPWMIDDPDSIEDLLMDMIRKSFGTPQCSEYLGSLKPTNPNKTTNILFRWGW
jgi:hypothetical protein